MHRILTHKTLTNSQARAGLAPFSFTKMSTYSIFIMNMFVTKKESQVLMPSASSLQN